ncbi:hypothetical protein ACEPAF_8642 [Sanghuangporus sanghuang]
MSYYNVDYDTSTYDYSYAYGSSQGEYPPTYAANYPADQIPKGGYSDAYGRTAAAFDNYNDTSRAGPSTFGGLANGTTNNAGKGPSMTFRGVPFFRPPAHGSETSALTEDGLGYVGYAHAELGQVQDEQTDPPVPHASRSHVQPSTFDSFISPGSSTHGSSEGEEPTPDTGVSNYSANGVPNRGYPIARRDRADDYYTSAYSSVGINTVGGLVNVTANGTQFGGPLTPTEGLFFHPSLHVSDTSGFKEHKLGYTPFNPTRMDSRGPISSAEEISPSSSDVDYSAFSDNLRLAQHETPAEMHFSVERTNLSPSINQGIDVASFHAEDRSNLGFTEQGGSMDFISNVGAGLSREPAFMSVLRTRFKPAENSSFVNTEFGNRPTALTGISKSSSNNSAGLSTGNYSLVPQPMMPVPGVNDKPQPDTSLDSCRDLQTVNHNKIQETQYVRGQVDVARLSRIATAFVPDANHAQVAAAAYAATPTNRASPSSGPLRSHVESTDRDPARKQNTTSTSREMKGKDKIKQSGSHLRQKPYNVGRSAPTSKYECSHGCKTWCRSKKELKRHEFRHERPDSYGWLCPGLDFPWAGQGSKACSCPTLGYTRSDDLVRHLKQRGPGNPCYEIALGLNWSPGVRGSIKNLPERYRPT